MTAWVGGADVSSAWLAAVDYLLALPGNECSNLGVTIGDPTAERPDIRTELDAFVAEARRRGKNLTPVDTVAGTIFQDSFYRPGTEDAEERLYRFEHRIRKVVRSDPRNRHGTYFERLVGYPAPGEDFNQLRHVLKRLRSTARQGKRNENRFELALFHPIKDPYPFGFPCLSHISITLRDGALDATALYRNQFFVERAYGNYLGIGQMLRFLALESGFGVGELLCVASHATLEAAKYGRPRMTGLIERCKAIVGDTP
jgi:hypothetical protein